MNAKMKKYSPVRICHPVPDTVINCRLLPCQDFNLVIPLDVDCQVTLVSDYLLLVKQSIIKNKTYIISQRFDFSKVSEQYNLFLGNLFVEYGNEIAIISLILSCKKDNLEILIPEIISNNTKFNQTIKCKRDESLIFVIFNWLHPDENVCWQWDTSTDADNCQQYDLVADSIDVDFQLPIFQWSNLEINPFLDKKIKELAPYKDPIVETKVSIFEFAIVRSGMLQKTSFYNSISIESSLDSGECFREDFDIYVDGISRPTTVADNNMTSDFLLNRFILNPKPNANYFIDKDQDFIYVDILEIDEDVDWITESKSFDAIENNTVPSLLIDRNSVIYRWRKYFRRFRICRNKNYSSDKKHSYSTISFKNKKTNEEFIIYLWVEKRPQKEAKKVESTVPCGYYYHHPVETIATTNSLDIKIADVLLEELLQNDPKSVTLYDNIPKKQTFSHIPAVNYQQKFPLQINKPNNFLPGSLVCDYFDPANLSVIEVKPGQELSIILPVPSKTSNELWFFFYSGSLIRLLSCENFASNNLLYQKTRFKIDESCTSFSPGIHQLGHIKAQSQSLNKIFFINVNIQNRVIDPFKQNKPIDPANSSIARADKPSNDMEVIVSGNGNLWINNFSHRNHVFITTDSGWYVQVPDSYEGCWQASLIHYPLPDQLIYSKDQLLSKINHEMPWIPTSSLIRAGKYFAARPLTYYQPLANKIEDLLISSGIKYPLPLFEVRLEKHNFKTEVENSDLVITNKIIRKSLYFYLWTKDNSVELKDLYTEKNDCLKVINPTNGDKIFLEKKKLTIVIKHLTTTTNSSWQILTANCIKNKTIQIDSRIVSSDSTTFNFTIDNFYFYNEEIYFMYNSGNIIKIIITPKNERITVETTA